MTPYFYFFHQNFQQNNHILKKKMQLQQNLKKKKKKEIVKLPGFVQYFTSNDPLFSNLSPNDPFFFFL